MDRRLPLRREPFVLPHAGATPGPLDEIVFQGLQKPRGHTGQRLTIPVEQSLGLSES